MLRVYICAIDHHEPTLVALAGLICLATAISWALLFRQAQDSRQFRWALAAGGATGFGLWATHFVAMLGYQPGMPAAYRLWPTLGSLAVAVVGAVVTTRLTLSPRRGGGAMSAAALGTGGIAAMHYLGVRALDLPARIHFDMAYVLASLVVGLALLTPAFALVKARRAPALAVLLLTLGTVGLHFTGMAAMVLTPARMAPGAMLLSPRAVSLLVSVAAGGVLMTALVALAHVHRMQSAQRARDREFSILADGISDSALCMMTAAGTVRMWNGGAERLYGYRANEIVGHSFARFHTAEDRAAGLAARVMAIAAREGKYACEGWRCRADGSRFWAHVTIERIDGADGRTLGFAVVARDMTRLKADQDRLAAMTAQLDTALDNMHQGLALFDADGTLVLCNQRLRALWHLDEALLHPGMARGAVVLMMAVGIAAEGRAGIAARLDRALSAPAPEATEIACDDGFVVSVVSRPLADGGWVATFEDITERRRHEARITHLALHDTLTGLANRAHFTAWCGTEMDHAARRGLSFVMVMIDLDGFKVVNDTRGHAAGDRTIVEIAARLQAQCSVDEMVARLGGDEFAAARMFALPAERDDFIARLQGCFAQPIGDADAPIEIGASIGVAAFPADAPNLEALMNNADLAMYRAKNGVGAPLCHYEPGMDETARARRQIALDLRHAIERDEFHLLYQPQHDLADGRLTGYEALLRWYQPERGLIPPDAFIPVAEETGAIFAIGEWVLREAARAAAGWQRDLRVAVNLSPVQLQQPDLVARITAILLETGLPPRRLELEITESAIIGDRNRALHVLRQIKALGIAIAIDDFGTGYASLDTLHAFPFDKIKIDKSFVMQSTTNPQSAAIVRAVLALGGSLGIPVLAEGVETRAQADLLRAENCGQAQGYFYGAPAPVDAAGVQNALLATGRRA